MRKAANFATLSIALAITACTPAHSKKQAPSQNVSKITFQTDTINSDGLRGPPNGMVSVAYEFCIPADEKTYLEVRRIDSSVQIHPGARGRIECSKDQALSIGNTHQTRWREVLQELSSLPYITEIRESFFE